MDSDIPDEEVLVPSQKPRIQRKSRSLSLLTKRFIRLLEEAEHGVLDVRHAFTTLAVKQIRRIYDITNVLEGIGLIVKISKCHVKWVAAEQRRPYDKRLLKLKSELNDLKHKEFILDQMHLKNCATLCQIGTKQYESAQTFFNLNMYTFSVACCVWTPNLLQM
uniref:E2F/DP family winged-helix DNA-binding domain-containing protein n=1 Tax=Fundulus heteroclitus TaxID=8078 RepID=A0A3Q2NYS1_FUNHE